jgi:hypothetical protein
MAICRAYQPVPAALFSCGSSHFPHHQRHSFDDQNANAVYDPGESGLAGVLVGLDPGCDGSGDATTTTGSDGSYTFGALEAGQNYCVDALPPEGYKWTLYPLLIHSLEADATGADFGFTNLPLFSWTPGIPDEGGSATFTAVDGFADYAWNVTSDTGAACASLNWAIADATGQTVALSFGASGVYQVCVQMLNVGWPIYDGQLVTVANVAPSMPYGLMVYPEPSDVDEEVRLEVTYSEQDPVTCSISAGVYNLCLMVGDGTLSNTACTLAVAYDPTTVLGGGSIVVHR